MMADGFTSQPRALQEYTRIIEAGGVQVLPCVGDFVFVTAAAVEFRCVIGGKSFRLMQGDHIRVERFRDLELHNLSDTNAITVTVVVGFGEFDRRVIQGTVTMLPGVLRADGTYEADTRQELALYVHPQYAQNALVSQGDMGVVSELSDFYTGVGSIVESACWDEVNREIFLLDSADGSTYTQIHRLDEFGNYLETVDLPSVGYGATVATQLQGLHIAARDGYLYLATNDAGSNEVNDGSIWRCLSPAVSASQGWEKWFSPTGGNYPGASPSPFVHAGLVIQKDTGYIVGRDASDTVFEIDPDTGLTVREMLLGQTGESYGLTTDIDGNPLTIWASGTDQVRRFDWDDPGVIQSQYNLSVNIDDACPFFIDGGLFVAAFKFGGAAKIWRVKQSDDAVILAGVALPVRDGSCACLGGLLKRNLSPVSQTTADLAVVRGDGRITVSGEVIKMALEFYRGRVPSDYLDHVFGIVARGVQYKTGQNSFLRLSVADDFTLDLPGVVRLTVDKNLL